MVENLSKYKSEILFIIFIAIIYFVLRLPNLTLQPIFADEAIYIRWAQVMKSEPTLRFVSLSDGKTPLFMWMMIPLFKVFHDPLFAGRFLSVLSGFGTMLGVYFLSRRVFGKIPAFLATILYVTTPYTIFFDRMALVDSMLATFSIWALYISTWLLKSQRLDLSFILGYLLGLGILTKTPGMFNFIALPLTLIGFNFSKKDKYSLLKLFSLWIIAILTGLVIYNILRLGQGFTQISGRNTDYIFSPFEIIKRPLDPFIPHLRDISDWFPKLLSWIVIIPLFMGTFFILLKRLRLGLVIIFWALTPFLIELFLLRTFTARYLLSSIPPFLVIAGFGLSQIIDRSKNYRLKFLIWGFLVLLWFLPLRTDLYLLTDPQNASIPAEERRGYFEEWTAGYGFPEIAQFLIDKKSSGPVVVGTEGYFGTLPEGLQIYLDKADIPIIGGQATVSAGLRQATAKNQTFYVANRSRIQGKEDGLVLIKSFPKAKPLSGGLQDAIVLYSVLPQR